MAPGHVPLALQGGSCGAGGLGRPGLILAGQQSSSELWVVPSGASVCPAVN